jgi:hypothetical protein
VNDIDDVLVQVRDSLSGARMGMPVEAILARSRSHRHRRRLARLSIAGVAASGVLALGLTGVFSSGTHAASLGSGTIRTAAFTLVSNANGTDTLTLNQAQLFNPGALQRALAQDDIPALVQSGSLCSSNPAPADNGVISPPLPASFGIFTSDAGQKKTVSPNTTWVINPAAMPAGTKLSFTYVNQDHGLFGGLIYDNGYTCSPVPAGS